MVVVNTTRIIYNKLIISITTTVRWNYESTYNWRAPPSANLRGRFSLHQPTRVGNTNKVRAWQTDFGAWPTMGPDNQKQDRTKKNGRKPKLYQAIPSWQFSIHRSLIQRQILSFWPPWLCHISNAKTCGMRKITKIRNGSFARLLWLQTSPHPFAKHIAKSHEAPLSEFGKVKITNLYSNIHGFTYYIILLPKKNMVFRHFLPVAPMRSSRSQSGAVTPE